MLVWKRKTELPRSTSIFCCLRNPKFLVFQFFFEFKLCNSCHCETQKNETKRFKYCRNCFSKNLSETPSSPLTPTIEIFPLNYGKMKLISSCLSSFLIKKTSELLHFNFDNTCRKILLKVWNK